MFAMDTIFIALLLKFLLIQTFLVITIDACPAVCACPNGTNQVTCIGVNLTSVPRDTPHTTSNLDLSNNLVETLSVADLSGLRNIVSLKLEGNVLQKVEDGSLASMDGLQTLDLSHNRLSIITEKSFAGSFGLMHLDLAHNLLQHVDGAFVNMKELSRLDLSSNQIQRITQFTFRDLENLRYLLISANQISHVDKRAFKNLEKLMYLVLKGNDLHRVSKFEFNSQVLSYVDLSECGLQEIPRGLPNTIRYLQLRRNNLTEISRRSFRDCPHVSILVLDENGLSNIDDRTFDEMNYLKQLWLNGNKLTHVPHPLPPSLQRLLMDQNVITQLSDVFPEKSQINTLSFMGNNISYLSFDTFSKLDKLTSLDLSNNKIGHLYGHTFINQTELKTLQFSKNPLTHFHSRSMWGLTKLKTLALAYVPTAVSIHPDVFSHFTSLERLDLDSSPWIIRTILSSESYLGILNSVTDLSMQSCELTYLRNDFPLLLPQLTTLHMSSTRWHCDTNILWLRNWLKVTSVDIIDKQEITCFTPRSVHGRSIESLSDGEFAVASTPLYTTTTTMKPLTTFRSTVTAAKTTTTTSAATTSSIKVAPAKEEGSATDDDSVEDYTQHNTYKYIDSDGAFDIYDIYTNFEFPDPFQDNSDNENDKNTKRPPLWEEILRRTIKKPYVKPTTKIPSGETRYSYDEQSDMSVGVKSVLSHSITTVSNIDSESIHSPDPGGTGSSTTIIIIVVTIATVIIAAIIITLIVYLTRKQQQNKENHPPGYRNGIKYNHKNDVLYFMPNGKPKQEGSTSDSIKTNSTSKEQMTLIPGRDINHEGPLRVYKWEDF